MNEIIRDKDRISLSIKYFREQMMYQREVDRMSQLKDKAAHLEKLTSTGLIVLWICLMIFRHLYIELGNWNISFAFAVWMHCIGFAVFMAGWIFACLAGRNNIIDGFTEFGV